MKDLNAEMDRIGRQMVACEDKCAGVSCDRPNGILPRCLILETAGRSNEGGCAIVGINPSHASRDESAYCMKEGVTYDAVVKYWQEKIRLQPYYEKLRKFADAFGLNGPILWTALAKCENADGIEFPPLRALRACTARFLTRELEAVPSSWPLIGVGREACLALAYHYPARTVIGVPNPKGSSGYHFLRHLPGGRLHEKSAAAVRHVLSNPPGELLWIGDVEHHDLLLREESRPRPGAQRAPVKAVGVGCAGGNAVNRMCGAGLRGVEFIAADSDAQTLCRSTAEVRIPLGEALTKGLGTEGDPAKGQTAARASEVQLQAALNGASMVFVIAGMGGGIGTGGAPVVAKLAKAAGALTVGMVTRPFRSEGRPRLDAAERGIQELRQSVDALMVITNDRLFDASDIPSDEAFRKVDGLLRRAVHSLSSMIAAPETASRDLNELRAILKDANEVMIGVGEASGPGRAIRAVHEAVTSPLLGNAAMTYANNLLVNIAGREATLTQNEISEVTEHIKPRVIAEAAIKVGRVYDESMGDSIRVTVIATGFAVQSAGRRVKGVDGMRTHDRTPDDRQAALDPKDLEKPAFMRRRVRRLKLPDDQEAAKPLDLDFGVSP